MQAKCKESDRLLMYSFHEANRHWIQFIPFEDCVVIIVHRKGTGAGNLACYLIVFVQYNLWPLSCSLDPKNDFINNNNRYQEWQENLHGAICDEFSLFQPGAALWKPARQATTYFMWREYSTRYVSSKFDTLAEYPVKHFIAWSYPLSLNPSAVDLVNLVAFAPRPLLHIKRFSGLSKTTGKTDYCTEYHLLSALH